MEIPMFFNICSFNEKETQTQVFSCEFCKIFQSLFFHKTNPVAPSVSCKFKKLIKQFTIKVYISLSTILCFTNVEVQLSYKNPPMKLCMGFPEFRLQYSLEISFSYISPSIFWTIINAIWWSDFFLEEYKFIAQTQ